MLVGPLLKPTISKMIDVLSAMQRFCTRAALMNSHMFPEMETVFLMTSERWFYVSSSRLREIVSFGADVSEFVPEIVNQRLREKLAP